MGKKKASNTSLDEANAIALTDLIVDPTSPDSLKVQIINKLMEGMEDYSFFKTIFNEDLSLGECPSCGHLNHWVIPEDDLNVMGFVSAKEDHRVPKNTTKEDCFQWQEACKKKKITI